MESILVSVGANKNDDVFIPSELWAARNSSISKPVNWEHNSGKEIDQPNRVVEDNQIIGHTYDCYATDLEGKVISGDVVPESFHVVTKDYLYKYLFPKAVSRVKAGCEKGDLFVSMEAWFKDYDYLVDDKIVARNEETAFLDNYLRACGGNGVYKDKKVKRVLKNYTFGGKGIVKRPANPPSVILSVGNENNGVKDMDEIEKLKKEVAELQGKLEGNGVKLTALKALAEKAMETVKASLTEEETKKLTAATIDEYISIFIDKMRQCVTVSHTLCESLKKEVATAKEENDKSKAALAKIEEDKKSAARLATIEKELNLTVVATDSEETKKVKASELARLGSLTKNFSDEVFASFIDGTKSVLTINSNKIKAEAPWMKDKDKEEETEEDKKKKEEDKAAADLKALETAKANESAPPKSNASPVPSLFSGMKKLAEQITNKGTEGK